MPRTETRVRTLYTFSELSPEAQGKAIDNYRDANAEWIGTDWAAEWRDSLSGFLDMVGVDSRYVDYEINTWGRSFAAFKLGALGYYFDSSEPDGPTGARLWRWIHNQTQWVKIVAECCPFTGYCGDEPLCDPIREFLARPRQGVTIDELLGDCLDRWAKEWRDDMGYQGSDEAIRETIEANEVEFLRDGSLA